MTPCRPLQRPRLLLLPERLRGLRRENAGHPWRPLLGRRRRPLLGRRLPPPLLLQAPLLLRAPESAGRPCRRHPTRRRRRR